ncbi:TauD/TfdA family dioxygenase [Kribbella sp. NBC_01505]|uniref:TauD/TfdA family dioxygenase n=1 Tax=Kribbella sp. NBC_01505 TaxID=2903580 RepID=UPI0038639948
MTDLPGPPSARRRVAAALPGTARRQEAVTTSDSGLPLLVRPKHDGLQLAEYAETHGDTIRRWRYDTGAVLFRGFGITLDTFGAVAKALVGEPEAYVERSSPRTSLGDRIYTATDYPPDQLIPLHNENSYQRDFPGALVFCCLSPAEQGGATSLADTRRVLTRIPVEVLKPFADHGVMYVRNFGHGMGLSWSEAFQTSSRDAVTAYCADHGIEAEWKPGGGLRTRQVRPAVARHPETGEFVWFNHAVFFNVHTLAAPLRAALLQMVGEEGLPYNTFYGDGRPIPAEVVEVLTAAYATEGVDVGWQAGDVLLVDNLLAAHGRRPFSGSRRVAVSVAAPISWNEATYAASESPDPSCSMKE